MYEHDYKLHIGSLGEVFYRVDKTDIIELIISVLVVEKAADEAPINACDCSDCIKSTVFKIEVAAKCPQNELAKRYAEKYDTWQTDEYAIGFSTRKLALDQVIKNAKLKVRETKNALTFAEHDLARTLAEQQKLKD